MYLGAKYIIDDDKSKIIVDNLEKLLDQKIIKLININNGQENE